MCQWWTNSKQNKKISKHKIEQLLLTYGIKIQPQLQIPNYTIWLRSNSSWISPFPPTLKNNKSSAKVPEGGDDVGGGPAHDEGGVVALGGLGDVIQARGQPHLRHPHLKEEKDEGRGVSPLMALSRVEAGIKGMDRDEE